MTLNDPNGIGPLGVVASAVEAGEHQNPGGGKLPGAPPPDVDLGTSVETPP